MGKFKNLFVEEVVEPQDYDVEQSVDEAIDVDSDVDTVNVVDDTYNKNGLSDKGKSIYKVEELVNSLPNEMVTDTKRSTVKSTLGVFGLTVQDVCSDGEAREEVLKAVLSDVTERNEAIIEEANTEIENLKIKIQEKNKLIEERKDDIAKISAAISMEVEKINRLIEFVGGDE